MADGRKRGGKKRGGVLFQVSRETRRKGEGQFSFEEDHLVTRRGEKKKGEPDGDNDRRKKGKSNTFSFGEVERRRKREI